jgi:hypothetical protein
MDVNIELLIKIFLDAQFPRVSASVTHRRLGGLFHNLA